VVLRTRWVYAMTSHNFLRAMLRLAGEREEIGVDDDQHGSGSTTWFGFAPAIFELAPGLVRRPRLRRLTTVDYPLPAPRPAWSVLDCSRLEQRFGLSLPHWREALVECLVAGAPT